MNKKLLNVGIATILIISGGLFFQSFQTTDSTFAEETVTEEPTIIKRESWENKVGGTLQFNSLIYSDGSIYIECINKYFSSNSSTRSLGVLSFDDNYYNINYECQKTEYHGSSKGNHYQQLKNPI